jgi:hypothetical protein
VIKEMPVATTVKDSKQRAAAAAMKEQRARDGAQALREYEAEKLALQAKTARLRALRLAKEAGSRQDTKKQRPEGEELGSNIST